MVLDPDPEMWKMIEMDLRQHFQGQKSPVSQSLLPSRVQPWTCATLPLVMEDEAMSPLHQFESALQTEHQAI